MPPPPAPANASDPAAAGARAGQPVILFVDDEPQSCKWFARTFADEFNVLTATGVDEALALLREHGPSVALLVTDYRMPQRNGLDLLLAVQRDFKHLVRLLATAYAEKDVAIAAINEGHVFRILEKPLDLVQTRLILREAMTLFRAQTMERALQENRMLAMRETLGFLAHELNTPLATVRGFVSAITDRYQAPAPALPATTQTQEEAAPRLACFSERQPGEVMAALAGAQRSALYCQSLVSAFVRSARDAYPGSIDQPVTASNLVQALLKEFPFEREERSWVSCEVAVDFALPGQRDLLYLVLSTLTKNALLALQEQPEPRLRIVLGREPGPGGRARPWIRFIDNGHGIAPEILAKLTREPVTTRAQSGGNGMGLMFCRRVVQSLGGSIELNSELGHGATVSLYFKP
ncbi:hybrid sensor histidine kinase/response regulator [Polaromonas sp. C04]|uniref:hybrid sensor histidine kinase/response regulator n=1 Tax=Polaromonas sp. C04 TaxID=1945857 RepID=UPI00098592D2|nr:hybrid sensor histidine kinase/response regulator [Polaromonas sp. C04]